jgi:nuclear transport factor 2 (NTF2) superfamily protein
VQPIKPPFTKETAIDKVKMAENLWNTCDPKKVVLAYTEDSEWRDRTKFFKGREEIEEFLKQKWSREKEYRLMKELWSYTENHISVRFECEWRHVETGQWYGTHGNELWEFNEDGLMTRRDMSANDISILENERKIRI